MHSSRQDGHRIVGVGTSLGGLEALRKVLSSLPADFVAPVLIVMHVGAYRSVLPDLLAQFCALPVVHPTDDTPLEPSRIYVAPPDRHLLVLAGRIRLTSGPKENFARPAIDPLFRSIAIEYGARAVAAILTGELDDEAAGVAAVHACGGRVIVQSPRESSASSMPASALRAVPAATIASLDDIGQAIIDAVRQPIRGVSMGIDKKPIEAETQIALSGVASPRELDRLGKRSTLSCPDCGVVVWEIGAAAPLRYRCHTGHAFSEASLDATQSADLENALWTAVRRVEERSMLAASRARLAETLGDDESARSERALSDRLLALQRALRLFVTERPEDEKGPPFTGSK